MSIQASCPNCGMTYALADQQAGQRVRCKKCQEAFKVPSAEERVVQQRPADTPPTRPGRPTERPSRSREDDRPTPSRRDESAAPRASKKSRDEAPYPLIPMPLLIGGLVAGAVLLIGVIGAAAWIFTSANISPTTAGNTVIDDNVANGPDQPNAKEPDNSNVAKGLEELKAATVFVKVVAGPFRSSGSGFLIKVDGNTGYVVTNDHVVSLKLPAGPGGRRGGPRELPPAEITLVFWSGTKQEQSYRADLVAADPKQDLAVLKVTGVANLPRPIDVTGPTKLTETLPVTVFGFPFGEALGGNAGNPAITVSQGSVSSIRRDKQDQVVAVQIDGALNPGNSGGPVLDAEGHLVGVAVATIRGAHIGLAVPSSELTKMLNGRVGEVRVTVRDLNTNAEVEVEVPLTDPLERFNEITVHYFQSDAVKDNQQADKEGNWPALPGAQRLVLRRDGRRAVGKFFVQAADKNKAFMFQASYSHGAGRVVYTQPLMHLLIPSGQTVAVRPPDLGPIAQPPKPGPAPRPPAPPDDPSPLPLLKTIQTPDVLRGASISPDGKTVATAGGYFGPGSAKMWSLETGKELADLPAEKTEFMAVAFAPDGNTVATASSDRLVRVWDRAGGKLKATCTGHANYVRSVVFSPDSKTLASSSDEALRLWDAETGKEKVTAKAFSGPSAWRVPTFMAFSPDGKTLASGTGDKRIKIWNVDTGEEIASLDGHANIVWAVVCSPDGKLLASASFDGTIRLWDPTARKELASFKAHDGWVHCIAITPDGKTLVSCGGDKKVKFWDVATHQERLVITLPEHAVSVSLTADGKKLAASLGKEVRIWDASKLVELPPAP